MNVLDFRGDGGGPCSLAFANAPVPSHLLLWAGGDPRTASPVHSKDVAAGCDLLICAPEISSEEICVVAAPPEWEMCLWTPLPYVMMASRLRHLAAEKLLWRRYAMETRGTRGLARTEHAKGVPVLLLLLLSSSIQDIIYDTAAAVVV